MQIPRSTNDWNVLLPYDLRSIIDSSYSDRKARRFLRDVMNIIWDHCDGIGNVSEKARYLGSVFRDEQQGEARAGLIANLQVQYHQLVSSVAPGVGDDFHAIQNAFMIGAIPALEYVRITGRLLLIEMLLSVLNNEEFRSGLLEALISARHFSLRYGDANAVIEISKANARFSQHTRPVRRSPDLFLDYFAFYSFPTQLLTSASAIEGQYYRALALKYAVLCANLTQWVPASFLDLCAVKEKRPLSIDTGELIVLESELRNIARPILDREPLGPQCSSWLPGEDASLLGVFGALVEKDENICCARALYKSYSYLSGFFHDRIMKEVYAAANGAFAVDPIDLS